MSIFKTQLSLEELQRVNDLLTSLVTGGVGLTEGIGLAQPECRGRVRKLLEEMNTQLQYGSSLSQALDSQPDVLPESYRAAIHSAEEGQVLQQTLEAYGVYISSMLEVRRSISRAMLYPMLLMLIGYILFVTVIGETTARFLSFQQAMDLPVSNSLVILQGLFDHIWQWVWIPPLALILLFVFWMRSDSGQTLNMRGVGRMMSWIPGVSHLSWLYRLTIYCEMLSKLVQNQVPFHQALHLAGATFEDRHGNRVAGAGEDSSQGKFLPPYLRWLIDNGQSQSDLSRTLSHAGEMYRRRADSTAEWIRVLAPLALLLLVGGGFVWTYANLIFMPLVNFIEALANQP